MLERHKRALIGAGSAILLAALVTPGRYKEELGVLPQPPTPTTPTVDDELHQIRVALLKSQARNDELKVFIVEYSSALAGGSAVGTLQSIAQRLDVSSTFIAIDQLQGPETKAAQKSLEEKFALPSLNTKEGKQQLVTLYQANTFEYILHDMNDDFTLRRNQQALLSPEIIFSKLLLLEGKIGRDDIGEAVMLFQLCANLLGVRLEVDGVAGKRTEAAIITLRTRYGLDTTLKEVDQELADAMAREMSVLLRKSRRR